MLNHSPSGTILIVHPSQAEANDCWESLLPDVSLTWAATALDAADLVENTAVSGVIAHGTYISESQIAEVAGLVERAPKVPVLVVSEGGTAESAVAALHSGAHDYLLAPVTPEQIQLAMRRAGFCHDADNEIVDGSALEADSPHRILTQDQGMQAVLDTAKRVADSDATVLILGESGTGKELLARYVHQQAGGPERPLVALNCAALPETLAESELFGHERGAFTGAISKKTGRFEQAEGGTLVLDEISEMPLALQAKLLRALQERVIDRVGGHTPIPVSVRVIAISNVDLRQAVEEGRFRKDLYYRINVIPLVLPPLNQRPGDIPLLAEFFMNAYRLKNKRPVKQIHSGAMTALKRHPWDGNIRELENTMERAVLVSTGNTIQSEHLMLEDPAQTASSDSMAIDVGMTVRDMEQALIHRTLAKVNDNRTQAAEMLGISIRTLRNKLKEFRDQEAA